MSVIDWIIIALFLCGLFCIIWWVVRHKTDDTSDYFLSGRSDPFFCFCNALIDICVCGRRESDTSLDALSAGIPPFTSDNDF